MIAHQPRIEDSGLLMGLRIELNPAICRRRRIQGGLSQSHNTA